jgi:isoleucyl-tRNA synthetase
LEKFFYESFSKDDFIFIKDHYKTMNNNQTPKTIGEKEKEVLVFWQENKIFEKSVETPASAKARGNFSFYDGPPFATGLPHYGHILVGVIKDAIPRYQTMKGNSVRRVWGWDCHGLPIENLIEKKLGLKSKKDIEDFGIDKFNRDAYESVLQYEKEWQDIVPRLGRWVDMDHPYKTMDATYTESIWWAWKTLYEKKLAYEGSKMMHICPRCETPLAQSEVGLEYHDVTDLSVTAKFEIIEDNFTPSKLEGHSPSSASGHAKTFVLAWTTTPWTLPGNTALAVHKDIEYVKVSIEGMEGFYIMAKSRVKELLNATPYTLHATFTGDTLVGKTYKPVFPYFKDTDIPYKENIWKIWHADFITDDAGTGIAHEAPAFGAEDMELAKANNIPVIKHVKMDGTFIQDVIDFAGMKVKQKDDTQSADIEIIKWLAHNGKLFEKHKIIHSYPLCWRCKTPLLNYATSSWFVDVPAIKEKLISENQKIGWTPAHTRDGRFGKWLEGAREWAVSRSRYWGAPLPVWKNGDGSEIKVIGSLKELSENSIAKPKNTYYVMRHGEAHSNVSGVLDKGTDEHNHLTEKGIAQVTVSAKNLHDKNIDMIFASPVVRGKETAELVGKELGVAVSFDDRLREYDMGIFDGKSREEYFASFTTSFVAFDARPEGGETHRDMMHRMMATVYDLERTYEGKTILLVTHGGPARMAFSGGTLLTEEEVVYDEIHNNGSLYPTNAEVRKLDLKIVPRDETGAVNLHRPYIDEVILKDSRGEVMHRIGDVFDCWFESGSMPFASIHYPFENKLLFEKDYPANFISEAMDQTRGWFYSLINLGVGLFDKAPYQHVIVSGLVLASSGVKLSKSEKNYTDPMLLVEKYGADAMRYALLSSPVVRGENLEFDDENVEEVYKKCISRLENVVQLYQMNAHDDVVPNTSSLNVLDQWMISRVHELVRDATKGYDAYLLDEATRGIGDIIDDISVWYTRRSRDRLKGEEGGASQKATYETLTYVLLTLAKVMAPVMPFIAERVYKDLKGEKESVHLESWPEGGSIDESIIKKMKNTRKVASLSLMERNKAKIGVRQPLSSVTTGFASDELYADIIADEINVKTVIEDTTFEEDEVKLDTVITEALQKEGDIRNLIRAIQDLRKEKGVAYTDVVSVVGNHEILLDTQITGTCKIVASVDPDAQGTSVTLSFGSVMVTLL